MTQPVALPPDQACEIGAASRLSWRLSRRRQWRLLALIAPLTLFLLAIFGYPIASFLSRGMFDPGLTAVHLQELATTPAVMKIFLLTFRIAAAVTLGSLLLAYPVAYVLASIDARIGNLLLILVLVSSWTSILVRSYAWMVILGSQGLINTLLRDLHVISSPLPLIFNTFAVGLAMVHIQLPLMILTLYSVMRGIDRTLLRAARSLGASPWVAFLRVFLPLTLPGIASGCILVFIVSLSFYITPSLVGGPTDYMITMFIDLEVEQLFNWGFAAVLSVILLASTVTIYAIFNRFLRLDGLYGGRR